MWLQTISLTLTLTEGPMDEDMWLQTISLTLTLTEGPMDEDMRLQSERSDTHHHRGRGLSHKPHKRHITHHTSHITSDP